MARYRVAVVAAAVCLLFAQSSALSALDGSKQNYQLADRFLGTSFRWEEDGTPHTLVIVSENTAWWISEENRFRSVLLRQPWQAKGKDEIVWYAMRFYPVSIKINGNHFSMNWGRRSLRGDVSRLRQ